MTVRNRTSVTLGAILVSGLGIGMIVGGAALAAAPARGGVDPSVLRFDPFNPTRDASNAALSSGTDGIAPVPPNDGTTLRPPVRDPFRPPTRSPYVPRPGVS